MGESSGNGELTIRESYKLIWRVVFRVFAATIGAGGAYVCYGIWDLYSSGESVLVVLGLALFPVFFFVMAYGVWCLHLELRIDKMDVAARAWPSPWTRIPIDQVLASEVVEINPFKDYGGWGIKGTERDRLIGGGGTTALRITYTHTSGGERKLTFLTDRADEAVQRLAQVRAR